MRPDIERLRLPMAAQVERQRRRARLTAQQKRHRSRAGRGAIEGPGNGLPYRMSPILFEQFAQSCRFVSRGFTVREGLIEKRFALRDEFLQAAGRGRMRRLPFALEHSFLMCGIKDQLAAIVAAPVARDLASSLQDADERIGSRERELPPHGFRRNRVLIQIGADIDRLGRTNGHQPLGGKRMCGVRQQAGLLFGEHFGDGAVIASGPRPGMRYLITPQPCLPFACGQRCEGASGPEGVPYIANGPFDAAFVPGRRMHLIGAHRDHPSG